MCVCCLGLEKVHQELFGEAKLTGAVESDFDGEVGAVSGSNEQ